MFSDHLRKIDQSRTKTLMLIAAGVVIVAQLAALVMLADGQVEKAQLREASQASARAATAWCVQSNWGAAIKNCDRTANPMMSETGFSQGKSALENQTLATMANRD